MRCEKRVKGLFLCSLGYDIVVVRLGWRMSGVSGAGPVHLPLNVQEPWLLCCIKLEFLCFFAPILYRPVFPICMGPFFPMCAGLYLCSVVSVLGQCVVGAACCDGKLYAYLLEE